MTFGILCKRSVYVKHFRSKPDPQLAFSVSDRLLVHQQERREYHHLRLAHCLASRQPCLPYCSKSQGKAWLGFGEGQKEPGLLKCLCQQKEPGLLATSHLCDHGQISDPYWPQLAFGTTSGVCLRFLLVQQRMLWFSHCLCKEDNDWFEITGKWECLLPTEYVFIGMG